MPWCSERHLSSARDRFELQRFEFQKFLKSLNPLFPTIAGLLVAARQRTAVERYAVDIYLAGANTPHHFDRAFTAAPDGAAT